MGRGTRIGTAIAAAALVFGIGACGIISSNSGSGTGVGGPIDTSHPLSTDPPPAGPSAGVTTPGPTSNTTGGATAPASPKPRPADKPLQCPKQPTTAGRPLSAKTVRKYLDEVAGTNEYVVAKVDPASIVDLGGHLPKVSIPLAMLKAVAAQESSWTSNCVAGDGQGYGIMQLDANTTSFINTKFGTGLSRTDPYQNIKLGNAYLEYLTVHFGILYFHDDFSLANTKLRTVVLAAYNTGVGTVDPTGNGSAPYVVNDAGQQYADTVVALMASSQPCQKTWGR